MPECVSRKSHIFTSPSFEVVYLWQTQQETALLASITLLIFRRSDNIPTSGSGAGK